MADKTMKLEIMSPDRNFYTGEVTMAEFNTTEGYIGVYPEHIPLAVILSPGVLVIHEPGGEKKAALHSGFAKIMKDKISIFAEIAEWPDEIDENRAREAKIRAERRISGDRSGIDLQRAEIALNKSFIRISLKN